MKSPKDRGEVEVDGEGEAERNGNLCRKINQGEGVREMIDDILF